MKNRNLIEKELKHKGVENPAFIKAFKEANILFNDLELYKDLYKYGGLIYRDVNGNVKPKIISTIKMLEKLNIQEGEKILLGGVESTFVLVALSKICAKVYAVETNQLYAEGSKEILKELNIDNVYVKVGDVSKGWEANAPYDKILIYDELENLTDELKSQVSFGGQVLLPIGTDWAHTTYEIFERVSESEFNEIQLREKFFITPPELIPEILSVDLDEKDIINEIKLKAIPFEDIASYPIEALLERIGDAKVVLLGEASHGTSEFYAMRQEITKALIEKKGFNFVCAEADWSDAEQVNNYVNGKAESQDWMPFTRFPQWMWKNKEVIEFVEWLKSYNFSSKKNVGFYGLDLYGMKNSIDLVVKYLEEKAPELAVLAKERYACLRPFLSEPQVYGKMVVSKKLESCEKEVLKMLVDILKKKRKLHVKTPEYFYAYQNANVVVDAEHYYKAMYYGSAESWNLRDFHMFKTLKSLLAYFGTGAKAIVWAHNSHIGNALATEMYSRGEINIGHLCKETYKDKAYNIGFGTHTGTVAAANNWGEKMNVMSVNPSLKGSYENLCYQTQVSKFTLPLREKDSGKDLRKHLSVPKLERAIGVIYRPQTERLSHYFHAVLPSQFDEYIWFENSSAVTPLKSIVEDVKLLPFHPFGTTDV